MLSAAQLLDVWLNLWVSLSGKKYMGGAIAHYDGRNGLFNHYGMTKEDWWKPVGEYVVQWKNEQIDK